MHATSTCLLACAIWNMALSAITWFDVNYMKLNEDKCHFLLAGNTPEFLWAKVGEGMIWKSPYEKLLGLTIGKKLSFNKHLSMLCKLEKFPHWREWLRLYHSINHTHERVLRLVYALPFDKPYTCTT